MQIKKLSVSYGKKEVLKDISFNLEPGTLNMILGKNGSGKSTLVKAIKKLIPFEGDVFLGQRNIKEMKLKEVAQSISYMAQSASFDDSLTVSEFLEFARHPYSNIFSKVSKDDKEVIKKWVDKFELNSILKSNMNEISGGQKQRVLLVSTLIQDTPVIILDEPNNNLDIKYKLELLDVIKGIKDKIFIFVTHDINDAIEYADRVILIDKKKIVFNDSPDKLLPKILEDTYHIKVKSKKVFTYHSI